ncbi:efflux transporter outer membrane subunit [Paraburkholderia kururiensis]|uniref:efflux transporter outer membrane subunit n=1 Tax=Paraburkholderia kururiensis TaxID=984307 RepID=UPI000F861B7E|nr:efflux transporter outer membrane subunit [Paraburkholderia kururiensis]
MTRHRSFSGQRARTGAAACTLAVATLLLVSACTVGPDFKSPTANVPGQWHDVQREASATSAASATAPTSQTPTPPHVEGAHPHSSPTTDSDPDPRWWHTFQDPTLDALIDRAVRDNPDLQQAVLRIAEARSQAQSAAAQGLPNVRATASYTREQLGIKGLLEEQNAYSAVNRLGQRGGPSVQRGANQFLDQLTSPVNLWQAGFDASWEVDLFGRVRRSVEAANAQTEAAMESHNDALVSLEAEVAQTYAQLRGAQQLRQITSDLVNQQREIVTLVQSQASVGITSQMDVQNASAQLAQTAAQLPLYDQQIAQALNGLAYLAGEAPGALDAELQTPGAVPPVPPTVPVGLPSTLARRRPDVRRAEAELHAATADVGVAVAQFYPDISLTGQVGTRAGHADNLARWSHLFYSFGPAISLPIFEGGQLVSNLRLSEARQAEAALAWRSAVLVALRDVDNALAVYRTDQARRDSLNDSVASQQAAFDLARDSYRKGLVTFINVLDAERQLAQGRQQAAQQTMQVTTDLVALYKALGGGWQTAASAGSAASADPVPSAHAPQPAGSPRSSLSASPQQAAQPPRFARSMPSTPSTQSTPSAPSLASKPQP